MRETFCIQFIIYSYINTTESDFSTTRSLSSCNVVLFKYTIIKVSRNWFPRILLMNPLYMTPFSLHVRKTPINLYSRLDWNYESLTSC